MLPASAASGGGRGRASASVRLRERAPIHRRDHHSAQIDTAAAAASGTDGRITALTHFPLQFTLFTTRSTVAVDGGAAKSAMKR